MTFRSVVSMPQLLTASDVSFSYGPHRVLGGVAVALDAGKVVGIIGPNGGGKSTLISALLGQIAATGTVAWDGKDVREWNRRELARRVAFLAQAPTWDPTQTVEEAVQLGRAAHWGAFGIESDRDETVVNEVIDSVGLSGLRSRAMHTLSGGQRQRVLIGRCLAQEPAALLLDEPDTYLDLRHLADLSKLVKTLARDRNIGILIASHDLNLASGVADELVLLKEGTVAARGIPRDVLRGDVLSDAYGVEIDCLTASGGQTIVVAKT